MTNWEPNEADLDLVVVRCACGNEFNTPRDTMMFMNEVNCGKCGRQGLMTCREKEPANLLPEESNDSLQ